MKKSVLFGLLLGVAFILPLQATTIPSGDIIVKSKVLKEKTILLTLANLQGNNTSISITDLGDTTLYFTKSIKEHNGDVSRLNLRKLPVGKYVITVRTKGKVLRQVIKIHEDRLFVSNFS